MSGSYCSTLEITPEASLQTLLCHERYGVESFQAYLIFLLLFLILQLLWLLHLLCSTLNYVVQIIL